ncbi:hypothetical protein MF672_010665 [Actinomadura sp. ATCC 31491]|uniref:DUF5076 domain-containing protein n=1 Tax=Actinomadura luzonensis TaxID=2805427 RepID=A0ABT0FQ31_9ACTN|nr:hypothetical protein [Actinomadura luzonensis]MCK2214248.1 hypothetical protein [Actinomadura luzonensis]
MPLPKQDPPARVIDERIRNYRMSTPRGSMITVALGGLDDPVTVLLHRPLEEALGVERLKAEFSVEESWAVVACLMDGLASGSDLPDWVNATIGPVDADGQPLPPLPGAPPAEPF